MSLERKDVRGKLDPEYHAAFLRICEADGVTQAEFIENLLVPLIRQRVLAAKLIADGIPDAGIFGSDPKAAGK